MHQSKGSLGMAKHRASGHATKSPKLRAELKREAEKNQIKRVRITNPKSSVRELIKK